MNTKAEVSLFAIETTNTATLAKATGGRGAWFTWGELHEGESLAPEGIGEWKNADLADCVTILSRKELVDPADGHSVMVSCLLLVSIPGGAPFTALCKATEGTLSLAWLYTAG